MFARSSVVGLTPTDGGAIANPASFLAMVIYGTSKPIDSDWPPLKDSDRSEGNIVQYLDTNGHKCSSAAFSAAVILIKTGAYKAAQDEIWANLLPNFVFMITTMDEPEVDSIYTTAVKPTLEAHDLRVARADEIHRAGLIMDSVFQAMAASRFVVADLTNARPNSYYELGYAHALGKQGILIAKIGTKRQFDVAGFRWNHWKPGVDFMSEFEAEVEGVLKQIDEAREPTGFPSAR